MTESPNPPGELGAATEDALRFAAIDDVLRFADELLPGAVPLTDDTLGEVFACAAIRRLQDLLEAEVTLARLGLRATSRLQGRSAIEAWLWASWFLLSPHDAIERLDRESHGHHRRVAVGMNELWAKVDKVADSDLPTPDPVPSRDGTSDSNIAELANTVAELRRGAEIPGADKAIAEYQLDFRSDSMHDVHLGFDVLIRYFSIDEDLVVDIHSTAAKEPADELRGVAGAFNTALLLMDATGLYVRVSGRRVPLPVYKRMLEIAALPDELSTDPPRGEGEPAAS